MYIYRRESVSGGISTYLSLIRHIVTAFFKQLHIYTYSKRKNNPNNPNNPNNSNNHENYINLQDPNHLFLDMNHEVQLLKLKEDNKRTEINNPNNPNNPSVNNGNINSSGIGSPLALASCLCRLFEELCDKHHAKMLNKYMVLINL